MNGLLTLLGIDAWKPIFTALLLPPVPLLLTLLLGARLILPRRGLGWFIILLSVAGLWLSGCSGMGRLLVEHVLKPPPALSSAAIGELQATPAKQQVAIVILTGGVESLAPEYGVANPSAQTLERLRYGVWLSRETGIAAALSGGLGWGAAEGQSEAQAAARVAAHDFGHPVKWLEDRSRDTHESAVRTVALLKPAGITHIVLVTHGYHMPRALKVFEEAAGNAMRIQPAPLGLATRTDARALDWIPTLSGYTRVHRALRELLALAVQA